MASQDDDSELRDRLAAAEERLRESEARHRLLIENRAQAVWETDAAGAVVTDSPSWRAYTGQTPEEWLGYGWLDAVHPHDRGYAERQWREAIAARGPVNAEFRLRAPDGGWRWTNVRAAPMIGVDGHVQKWLGLNIDIDDRARAELALRENERKYRSLFENMGQGYCHFELIRDANGRAVDQLYLKFNPAFERLFGIPAAEAEGRKASEIFGNYEEMWVEAFERVVRTHQPERIEQEFAALDRWFEATAYPDVGDRLVVLFEEITARKHAEKALRENSEQQAFLLQLSDHLRAQVAPAEIERTALALLAEKLGLDRAHITRLYPDEDRAVVGAEASRGFPPVVGVHRPSDFPETFRTMVDTTLVSHDMRTDLMFGDTDRRSLEAVQMVSLVVVSLREGAGRVVWSLACAMARPRQWAAGEVTLIENVAERIWAAVERASAEAALRESEESFRQFAEASAAGMWIRDAATLKMEYISPAVGRIYGARPEAVLDGVQHWAGLILPEDRDAALARLEEARRGEAVVHEFRIRRPDDGAFRWIRNTDFPLFDAQGRVQRIGGLAEDVTEAKLLTEHQGVLLAELQHRVRNIMAVIRSMALRTADGAADVEDYRSLLEGRLLALARVQVLLTRQANAGGSLRDIIESEVGVQAGHRGQFELDGPDIRLSPKAVEVLTLAFHELATNALKYGAFSAPNGRLRVSWATFERRDRTWLALDWTEAGAPSRGPVTRRGFGSDLIEGRIPYELGGTGKVVIGPGGAQCRLEFPLKDGESILETDAPTRAVVFGGALDMTDAPDLTGRRVLVVEDDYYMAGDTAAALRGAGAAVLGPCPTEDAARDLLEGETPTHAVLDLNLGGGGPRFEMAHLLEARGVPFVFLTGYDPGVIPADLEDVVRLQKPVPFRDIVEAVSQL